MTPTRELVPLSIALKESGFTKKSWSKLLEVELARPAQRLAGGKKYALVADQVDRLRALASLRAQLGKGYTLSAAAFALARSGDQTAPIGLVKDHLRNNVVRAQGRLRRTFQRYLNLSSNTSLVTEHDVNVAAKKIARKLTKDQPGKSNTYEFLLLYSAMMLRMMYLGQGVDDYAGDLARLMTPFVRIHHPFKGPIGMPLEAIRENATKLAAMISDMRGSLRLDDQNIFFRKLGEIPDLTFWKLLEMTPRVADVAFNSYQQVSTVIPIPKYNDLEREWFRMAILMTLVAHYEPANPSDTFRELLAGSTATVESLASKLVGIIKMAVQIPRLLRLIMRK